MVQLRQLERQTAREKERNSERMESMEKQHHAAISKLQKQMKSIEAQRNLLMVREDMGNSDVKKDNVNGVNHFPQILALDTLIVPNQI